MYGGVDQHIYMCYSQGGGLNTSLSRCTRELISIYMCYSQGDGLNTSLSRLSNLVLYTVFQLSGYPLIPYLCTVPSTLCIGRS